jgi:hypothetical protein
LDQVPPSRKCPQREEQRCSRGRKTSTCVI